MSDQEGLEAQARGGAGGPVSDDDVSEQLDDDKLAGTYPPDEPVGVDEYGITPQEQRVPEPIEERVARERPEDDTSGEPGGVGRLVAPDEGSGPDDEGQAVARDIDAVPAHDLPVGDVGTGDATTHDVATERSDDASAEEAAMHLEERP